MSHWLPSPAEADSLRFLTPAPSGLRKRLLWSAALFVAGSAIWVLAPWAVAPSGLVIALAGHLPLWVRSQTNAPGGATPLHEEMWAPVDDGWIEQVDELERSGQRWDASPWDITNRFGALIFLAVAGSFALGVFVIGSRLGFEALVRLGGAAAVLLLPIWINGMRTTWNPSELRLKGDALAVARTEVEVLVGDLAAAESLDPVPLLALRDGKRGKYPVDARLMLRPAGEDDSGFLGIQVQVALNNVQGTDYPYLYCVVLGKQGFELPPARRGSIVYERGSGADVEYLVIRQHADQSGGWHTRELDIAGIVRTALKEGLEAWRRNRGGGS